MADAGVWSAGEDEGRLWFQVHERSGGPAVAEALLDPGWARGVVTFEDPPSAVVPAWYSPLLQLVASHALAARGGLLLHAASVVIGEEVWLLAGDSGAGKTTLARALESRGGRVLADDRSALWTGAELRAAGSPWGGEMPCHAGSGRVSRVLFLQKGGAHRARRLLRAEAVSRLLRLCLGPFWNRGMMEALLAVCETVGKTASCEELWLAGDGTAADWLLARED